MGWNLFCKYYNTYFKELNLTRKENALRNPKAPKNKKVQGIFEETNFEHCRNDEWFFTRSFFFLYWSRKATSKYATLLLRHVANFGNKVRELIEESLKEELKNRNYIFSEGAY